ncbi:MAG: TIR domain-containing protein [Candidatus Thiodiazotropha sp.]
MARKCFYSFHYNPDNWRVSTVRNIGRKSNQDRHHLKEENRLPASICFCWNKIKTAFD